ncbi:leucine-rich melanocyte differentiation-associated protein isoform X2 [Bombyx mori]|uniref:Leucine-rich melanocyte differentiation-associated protein-like n=2 Tax=Bombyx mori TaxID=7091 RepID=A0A8R2LW33_BOMMO|nr:leucine-rich melanocyte differentiation-associated protein isoform X2 [Bombyx mori]
MDDKINNHASCSSVPDEGVISVDLSRDIVVDSMTDMTEAIISPNLIVDNEEDSTKLTLAYEWLYEVPRTIVDKFSNHIKYLDISHNKITNLDPLVHFFHLSSLIADHNPITENCALPPLPKLELLWLNHCKIASLYPWVGKLKESCPNLQYLCLMGNPAAPSYFNGGTFYEYLQYRLFIISQFPLLNHLDDRKVTDDQRTEALRLYKRPFLERLVSPGSRGGISQLMQAPAKWNTVHGKLNSLWSKAKNRNLLI